MFKFVFIVAILFAIFASQETRASECICIDHSVPTGQACAWPSAPTDNQEAIAQCMCFANTIAQQKGWKSSSVYMTYVPSMGTFGPATCAACTKSAHAVTLAEEELDYQMHLDSLPPHAVVVDVHSADGCANSDGGKVAENSTRAETSVRGPLFMLLGSCQSGYAGNQNTCESSCKGQCATFACERSRTFYYPSNAGSPLCKCCMLADPCQYSYSKFTYQHCTCPNI
jgi:hypothetical protein